MKSGVLCVSHRAQLLCHNLKEHIVCAFQHLGTASEILMELYLLKLAVLPGVGLIFFQKQLRSGQTEFVNTLLHISYHKYVRLSKPLSGNCPDQGLLHQIAVLILVHQDLVKLAGQIVRRLAQFSAVSIKNL